MATNIDDLVNKSKKNITSNELELAQRFLEYDAASVKAREALGGSLDLSVKENRETFSKTLIDELYSAGAVNFAKQMFNGKADLKPASEVSNAMKATILGDNYAIDPEQIHNLVSQSNDINQIMGYLQGEKTRQKMVDTLMSKYVQDSHEHLRKVSDADRLGLVNNLLNIDNVLNQSGKETLAKETNYKTLGQALYDNDKLNGLNSDYFKRMQEFKDFVIDKPKK